MATNPDLIEHPSQPLKMNRYDREEYNLYWKNTRAGFLYRSAEPNSWTCYLAVQNEAGDTFHYNNTFESVEQAVQELRVLQFDQAA